MTKKKFTSILIHKRVEFPHVKKFNYFYSHTSLNYLSFQFISIIKRINLSKQDVFTSLINLVSHHTNSLIY